MPSEIGESWLIRLSIMVIIAFAIIAIGILTFHRASPAPPSPYYAVAVVVLSYNETTRHFFSGTQEVDFAWKSTVPVTFTAVYYGYECGDTQRTNQSGESGAYWFNGVTNWDCSWQFTAYSQQNGTLWVNGTW